MGAFDFSGIGLKSKTSQDYGFLIDQLDIKKNQLESDGKLSPGDYDLLMKQAQEIYAHPGLSQTQRSNILVKISTYQQEKKTSALKTSNDIGKINNELKDDYVKNGMLFGNNPRLLLESNLAAVRMKIDQLSQSIDLLSNAGDDASSHINEYNETLSTFNELSQAIDDVENYGGSGKPTSNFVAYITTNSSGEITNVEVGRTGSKTGYSETNGLYGGLQIYGKVNRKEFGKNIFVLGNEIFSGSDLTVQDPDTPGAFRSAPLLSKDAKQGKNVGLTVNSYKDVDLNYIKSQTAIRDGGWAEGSGGFLYQRTPDGKYKKYVNADKEKLGISDNDIIKLPKVMEDGLSPNITETIDGSSMFNPPISSQVEPSQQTTSTPSVQDQQGAQDQQTQQGGTSRTPSPTVRAPKTAGGIAQRALGVGKGILNYLFSGGQ